VVATDHEFDDLGAVRPQVVGTSNPSVDLRQRLPHAEDAEPMSFSSRSPGDEDESMLAGIRELWYAVPEQKRTGTILAIFCAWDLLASASVVFVAVKFGYRDNGLSLYCLACQALSHLLSSLLLLFRLFGDLQPERQKEADPTKSEVSEECLLQERRRRDVSRERGGSIAMGILMWVCSTVLLATSVRKYILWDEWHRGHKLADAEVAAVTIVLAWSGFVIYTLQAAVRFAGARKLGSRTIWNGVIISLVSLIFLMVLAIAASFEHDSLWQAEPAAASALAIFLFFEGARVLYWHKDEVSFQLLQDVG